MGHKNLFAQLADPNHHGLFTEGTRFFAGRFDTMMFGLPAACLAMYHCVPKKRRAQIGGLFLGAALTSFITGITERSNLCSCLSHHGFMYSTLS